MSGRNARIVMRRPATAMDVRYYFESDATVVSSPLTVFGRLTSYGRDFLERFAPHVRGRRVLDAGAGLGVVSVELAHHYGAFVVALDYSHWVTGIEREAHPVQADLMCLPLADLSFDTVICMEVLEHTLNPDQALAEIWRVLRPGGALILSTPSYMNVAGVLKVVLESCGVYERDTFAPFDSWKPKVLERRLTAFGVWRILRRHGFRVQRVEGAEIFDAMLPFANRIPGLFENEHFLRLRARVDRSSSWPLVKWFSLHGIFLAERPVQS
jgi:2-polyprenyl-3-methyl-5-hydroxy-6-metoxy-1,4-benzoquinol methylase